MLLLVGLGNPGRRHASNRHNVGFMALEAIALHYGFGRERRRFHGAVREGLLGGKRTLALWPRTYMNRSGQAVEAAVHYYRLAPSSVIVFHDELDLSPGKVRVKRGGGTAGHNGLRDIDSRFASDFRRVRIGIGHPGYRDDVMPYVLSDFAKADAAWLGPLIEALVEGAPLLALGDDPGFMTKVALILNPPPPKPPQPTKDILEHEGTKDTK